jgi:nucleotide-binding universal stress UspA family protein
LYGNGGESSRRENVHPAGHDLLEFRTQIDPNGEKRGEIMSKTRIGIWGTTTKLTLTILSVLFLSAAPTVFAGPRPNDSEEVTKLMSEVKSEAAQLKDDAEDLRSFTRSKQLSWHSHVDKIEQIKQHVNKSGELLSKLQNAKASASASAWQKQAIDEITPLLRELAANVTSTIEHLNKNQQRLHTPPYTDYVASTADLATDLSGLISDYVAGLARYFGSSVFAFHVRPIVQPFVAPPFGEPMEPIIPGPTETEIREDILKELSGLSDIPNEVVIADGDVWLSAQTAIDEKTIDLIVLGTSGRTGLSKLVLGSVTEEILRCAPCAVLTVGPHAPSVPARGGEFSEIHYATDFNPEAFSAAPYAISLAQEFQAHLSLLHVIADRKVSDLSTRAEVESAYEYRLRQIVPPGSELWCEPHFIVLQGSAPDDIFSVANQRKADLIIIGVHRPSGFATHLPIATAHQVVSNATCPILTVQG